MSLETETLQATPPTSTFEELEEKQEPNLTGGNAGIPSPLCKTCLATALIAFPCTMNPWFCSKTKMDSLSV